MWSAAKAAAEAADTAVGEEFTEECGEGRQRRWRRRHLDYGQRRRWLGSKVRAWEAVRRAAGILFQVAAAKRWQQGWRPRVLLRLRGRTHLCKTSPQSTRRGRERRRRRRRQHKRKRRRIRQGLGGRGDGAAQLAHAGGGGGGRRDGAAGGGSGGGRSGGAGRAEPWRPSTLPSWPRSSRPRTGPEINGSGWISDGGASAAAPEGGCGRQAREGVGSNTIVVYTNASRAAAN